MSVLQILVRLNRRLSKSLDRALFPRSWTIDGNSDYCKTFVPRYLLPGIRIYDVGGGKHPFLSVDQKESLVAHVIGVDISAQELMSATVGAYDEIIVSDICAYHGSQDGDLVLCQALLEHVRDNRAAFRALASLLKPGGRILLFVPSRNALYARLNLVLPERLKRILLFVLYPEARRGQGFVSYYDRCTPRGFVQLAREQNLVVEDVRYYFMSDYFSFFFPLYLLWRVWLAFSKVVMRDEAAETFVMALRKDAAI